MEGGSSDPVPPLLEDNGFVFKPLAYLDCSYQGNKATSGLSSKKDEHDSPVISIIPKKRPHPSVPDPVTEMPSLQIIYPSGFEIVSTPPESVKSASYHSLISRNAPLICRMKQLLVWCANDTIESKKSNIPREVLGPAQEIMLQTIKEVLDDRLNISWYSLPSPKKSKVPKELKKHPENVACIKKIEEYKKDIKAMNEECIKWDKFLEETRKRLKRIEDETCYYSGKEDPVLETSAGVSDQTPIAKIMEIARDSSVIEGMSVSEINDLVNSHIAVEETSINDKIESLGGKLDDISNTLGNISAFSAAVGKSVNKIFTKFHQDHEKRTKLSYPMCSLDLLKLHVSE